MVSMVDRRRGERHAAENPLPERQLLGGGPSWQYAVVVPSLDLIVVNRLDEKQTRRTIGKRQMARMVRLAVDAAPKN